MKIEQIIALLVIILFLSADVAAIIFGMNSGNETFYILGLLLLVISVTLVFIFAIGWALAALFIG